MDKSTECLALDNERRNAIEQKLWKCDREQREQSSRLEFARLVPKRCRIDKNRNDFVPGLKNLKLLVDLLEFVGQRWSGGHGTGGLDETNTRHFGCRRREGFRLEVDLARRKHLRKENHGQSLFPQEDITTWQRLFCDTV